MKLDYVTLFTVMGFLNIIIVLILLYYITTANDKKWFIVTYIIYKILETSGIVFLGFRNVISDFLSIYVANFFFIIYTFIHLISVVSFKGNLNKRFAYLIGFISIITLGLFFTAGANENLRVFFVSYGIALVHISSAIFLLKNGKPFKMPFLITVGFLLFALTNIIRGTNAILGPDTYRFVELASWDLLFLLSGVAMILISSFGFLLLLREVDESIIFKQNRLNKIAFDQSPVSIVITDTEGKIEYVNPKFSSLTGYTQDEVKGEKTKVLKTSMTPKETFADLWQTIKAGNVWHGEFVNKKKNNEVYYEEAVIAPVKDEKQKIINYLAIKTDITRRKADEELIQHHNEELTELNSTKDRLFSIIAHDLRGPIGNLQQLLEIIAYDINQGDRAKVDELLLMLKSTARTSFVLLDNLLSWSRSQLNAISLETEHFNLALIISDALNLMETSIKQKNISVSTNDMADCTVFADRPTIDVVVRNLLSNAIKFTPRNGEINICIDVQEKENILSIADTGVGIEEDRLEKIFSFAENRSTRGTAGEKGTGLGLVLSNEFVVKNNGRIWAKSSPGEGSIFYVALPK